MLTLQIFAKFLKKNLSSSNQVLAIHLYWHFRIYTHTFECPLANLFSLSQSNKFLKKNCFSSQFSPKTGFHLTYYSQTFCSVFFSVEMGVSQHAAWKKTTPTFLFGFKTVVGTFCATCSILRPGSRSRFYFQVPESQQQNSGKTIYGSPWRQYIENTKNFYEHNV